MSKPSTFSNDAKVMEALVRDLEPLFRYRDRVTNDPLRLAILAAHALIEEMIELVIAEAVPNSECFEQKLGSGGRSSELTPNHPREQMRPRAGLSLMAIVIADSRQLQETLSDCSR
jgi:hypothetical protein